MSFSPSQWQNTFKTSTLHDLTTPSESTQSSSLCDASRRLTLRGERLRHGDSDRLLDGVRDTDLPRSGSGVKRSGRSRRGDEKLSSRRRRTGLRLRLRLRESSRRRGGGGVRDSLRPRGGGESSRWRRGGGEAESSRLRLGGGLSESLLRRGGEAESSLLRRGGLRESPLLLLRRGAGLTESRSRRRTGLRLSSLRLGAGERLSSRRRGDLDLLLESSLARLRARSSLRRRFSSSLLRLYSSLLLNFSFSSNSRLRRSSSRSRSIASSIFCRSFASRSAKRIARSSSVSLWNALPSTWSALIRRAFFIRPISTSLAAAIECESFACRAFSVTLAAVSFSRSRCTRSSISSSSILKVVSDERKVCRNAVPRTFPTRSRKYGLWAEPNVVTHMALRLPESPRDNGEECQEALSASGSVLFMPLLDVCSNCVLAIRFCHKGCEGRHLVSCDFVRRELIRRG